MKLDIRAAAHFRKLRGVFVHRKHASRSLLRHATRELRVGADAPLEEPFSCRGRTGDGTARLALFDVRGLWLHGWRDRKARAALIGNVDGRTVHHSAKSGFPGQCGKRSFVAHLIMELNGTLCVEIG